MFDRFTETARRVVVLSQEEARALNHPIIHPCHLLLGVGRCGDPVTATAFERLGFDYRSMSLAVAQLPFAGDAPLTGIPFGDSTKKVLELAVREALQLGQNHVDAVHLLLGIARDDSVATAALFATLSTTAADIRAEAIRSLAEHSSSSPTDSTALNSTALTSASPVTSANRSALETYATNLTDRARGGLIDPVVGREAETLQVMQILSRRTKNNPVLIGEAGVGKTAVVDGLAQRIADGNVPAALGDVDVWALDLASLLAGTRFRGDFEERLTKLIGEVTARDDTILFLDELHTLIGAGAGEGALDAANILKPLLARGELRIIGATTVDEYRRIESDAALERRFAPVQVAAPTVSQAISILRGLRPRLEQHHQVTITDAAVDTAVRLTDRYVPERQLPDKAIELLDDAASRLRLLQSLPSTDLDQLNDRLADLDARLHTARSHHDVRAVAELGDERDTVVATRDRLTGWAAEAGSDIVDVDQVAATLAERTGIPLTRLGDAETSRLLTMETVLGDDVIGQDAAVAAVAAAVRRNRSGVRDPRRPVASLLFAGPTGVGKTELPRALARFLFGSDDALISFDMGEFAEKHTVARLGGAPPGYVGHDDGGQLTEAVRRRPHSVIVFDEVEKAHPEVFDTLLRVLDEGRLTDSTGRTVDFRNTVIVLTTNLGTAEVSRAQVGFAHRDTDGDTAVIRDAVRKHFRPEFLNRLDDIVVFSPLSLDTVARIVDRFTAELSRRLVAQGVEVTVTDAARTLLARDGYDPAWGARLLRRTFTRLVEDPLSELLLAGAAQPGDTVVVDTETAADGTVTVGVRTALGTFPSPATSDTAAH